MRIVIRRDTSANWVANGTVVLLLGEQGYETDTRMMKVGDGTTQYKDLPYFAGGITGVDKVTIDTDAFGNLMLVDTVVGEVGDVSIKDYVDAKDSVLGAAIAKERTDRIAADGAEVQRVNELIASGMWLYASTSVFPDATTNHGRVVHSHADGAMFYAHAGAWHRLEKADDASTERDSITARLDSHEDSIGALDSRVLGNTRALNIARDSITALDAEISNLALVSAQADTALDNKIIALDARVDTVEPAVDGLGGRLDTVEPAVDALGGRLDTVEPAVDALGGRLDTVEPAVDALGGRLDTVEPAVEALGGRMDTVEPAVEALGGRLDTVEPALDGLSDSVAQHAIDISNTNSVLGAQISVLGDRLDTVEPAVDGLGGRLDTVEPAVYGLGGRLDTVEPAVDTLGDSVDAIVDGIIVVDKADGVGYLTYAAPDTQPAVENGRFLVETNNGTVFIGLGDPLNIWRQISA